MRPPRRAFVERWRRQVFGETESDPVPTVVDYALQVCYATADTADAQIAAQREIDRLLWLKIANRNVNTFMNTLADFEDDLSRMLRRGSDLRCRAAAFQQRLNRVLPRKKGGRS